MPYISKNRREQLNVRADVRFNGPGELNYAFTKLGLDYLKQNGTRYQSLNDVIGALEGAKLELYRRVAADYEDEKCLEAGDVYDAVLALRNSQ